MAKTMIKNVCDYIRSKNSNWFTRGWLKKRTMQVISYLLKMMMLLGIVIFVSEPTAQDTKAFVMTFIIKSIISAVIVFTSYVLSTKIDEAF